MKGRGVVVGVAAVALVLGLLVLIGGPGERTNRAFDPSSSGPLGSRGVVLLLEELGADVDVTGGGLDDDVDTALVLVDRLDRGATDELEAWVEGGGVLVVADQRSSLFRGGAERPCPAALDDVEELDPGPGSPPLARGAACFDRRVSSVEEDLGSVVSVRDRQIFTNELLGAADNAVLVAALLAPTGEERVAFVAGSVGTGEQALTDLLGPRVAQALGQLAVAFLVYALWRARRLGRAVVEPQPVSIAGSELVAAVGRLQQGRRRPAEVADIVRSDLLRAIERRLGVAAGGDVTQLAEAVAAQCALPPEQVLDALARRPVVTDDDLLAVLGDLDRIRACVLAPLTPVHPGGS